ncbi:hypothetical protein Poli38472_010747 [Pythium oligandrum]|uniref:Uncharacterized protein n=1 Tax=Pythium oligandrum TaxID=41045 RepID=A0A8K1CER3_PYTOL|nr:hypothetical protein Poli38472_010747 [Pythium oligandrum]|eukprot:TMW61684.1 hypothetical protein Poli38472_010747 [Pythium oligandrum]
MQVGTFVWQKWRDAWFMATVVAQNDEDQVQVHVHGEHETTDRWVAVSSATLVRLRVIETDVTAIGVFPHVGDTVELLVMDEPLASAWETAEEPSRLLTGVVMRVYPARDASLVDVEYPPHDVADLPPRRRVCVGHGYIRLRTHPDDLHPSELLAHTRSSC